MLQEIRAVKFSSQGGGEERAFTKHTAAIAWDF